MNNPDKSYTEKKATHRSSGYSLVTCFSFDKSKNERKFYRGEDCMKIFGKDLKDQATKIINYEKKEMIPLTDEEKETHENQKTCYICEKQFFTDKNSKEFRKMQKVRDYCHYTGKYRGAAHSNCNLNYKIPKEIPVVFHNGSTYDCHFIIKQLAREFKGNFECLGENTEKHITFSVPIKKEHSNAKTATYKLKFIDSCRFMQDSLSNIVDNLSEINNKEPKDKFYDTMRSMTDSLSQSIDKVSEIDREISQIDEKEPKNKFIDNMRSMMTSLSQSINKISEIDRKISQIDKKEPDNKFIDNMRSMMTSLSLSIDKVSEIDNKISQIDKKETENKFTDNMRSMVSSLLQSIDKVSETDKKISQAALIEKFPNTNQLCNKDLNKFALLLRKGVYPYEYMDSWKRFKEESLPDKESFYSELNNEHITDEDYAHAQKV